MEKQGTKTLEILTSSDPKTVIYILLWKTDCVQSLAYIMLKTRQSTLTKDDTYAKIEEKGKKIHKNLFTNFCKTLQKLGGPKNCSPEGFGVFVQRIPTRENTIDNTVK